MQFQSEGQIYKAVHITGPTHNYLGIEFTQDVIGEVDAEIEALKLAPHEPERLDAAEVRANVMNGVREVNDEIGTNYRVKRIMFVVSDSAPASIYSMLAKRIVHRMHKQPHGFNGSDE